MSFDKQDGSEYLDLTTFAGGAVSPIAESAAKELTFGGTTSYGGGSGGGYGGGLGGYAGAWSVTPTPTSELISLGGKVGGFLGGVNSIISGAEDMADDSNHWLGQKGLGLANVVSGSIGTASSALGLLGCESGFLGGLAGATGATGAAAGAGAALAGAGGVLGAAMSGVGIGQYGDKAFKTMGGGASITDLGGQISADLAAPLGGSDTVAGTVVGGLSSAALALPGAHLALMSTLASPYVGMGRAIMNAVGHHAE